MQQERYGKEVARIICQLTFMPEALVIRDDGVFVKDQYQELVKAWGMEDTPMGLLFVWKYSCDMDWPDAPNPLTTPSLPIPFTCHELAAFMLEGLGESIQWQLGSIDDGPDEKVLLNLGMQATKVRKVFREAYILARNAQEVVGKPDYELQQRASALFRELGDARTLADEREGVFRRETKQRDQKVEPIEAQRKDMLRQLGRKVQKVLRKAYRLTRSAVGIQPKRWAPELLPPIQSMRLALSAEDDEMRQRRARAKASVADLEAEAYAAEARAKTALEAWRKAMVRQLLQPEATTPSTAPVIAESPSDRAAPANPQAQAAKLETAQAPPETTDERCTRLLQWFEDEKAKKERGALAKVVKRDGRARQTVTNDIKRARKQREAAANPIGVMAKKLI